MCSGVEKEREWVQELLQSEGFQRTIHYRGQGRIERDNVKTSDPYNTKTDNIIERNLKVGQNIKTTGEKKQKQISETTSNLKSPEDQNKQPRG